jgi:hypothetical protein
MFAVPRRWKVLGWATLVLAGCARPNVLVDPHYAVERGRSAVVVVPAQRDGEEAGAVSQAASLLAQELGSRWFNVVALEHLVRDNPESLEQLRTLARHALSGRPLDRALSAALYERHWIGQVLIVDLFRYEQIWGRLTKITRVGIEARLVLLEDGRVLWRGRYAPEVGEAAGHSFAAATRQAVQGLVRALRQEWPDWREVPLAADLPVLEYLAPN